MTEIVSEDDLWKLFWKEPPTDGHKQKGEGFIYSTDLQPILDAKSFGTDGKSKLALTDETRRYLVAQDNAQAFVRQCDLRTVIKALAREPAGPVHIGYLGPVRTGHQPDEDASSTRQLPLPAALASHSQT